MASTRRLAATLAADVAGYSRLMGRMRKGRSNASRRIAGSWSIQRSQSTAVTVATTVMTTVMTTTTADGLTTRHAPKVRFLARR